MLWKYANEAEKRGMERNTTKEGENVSGRGGVVRGEEILVLGTPNGSETERSRRCAD